MTTKTVGYTPGPWEYRQFYENGELSGFTVSGIADIPEISDTAEANARLVAAAPELLEALEHFFEWHADNFETFADETNMQLLCLANEAEVAIRKAKGEL